MDNRFQFSFEAVDKKILRKNKDFKSKNKYSLKEVDSLINWIQNNWKYQSEIALVCQDKQEGDTLAFDVISVTPFSIGGKAIDIMQEIEQQLLSVNADVLSNPDDLFLAFNNQFKNEPDIRPLENNNGHNEKNVPASNNKFSLGFLKKKAKETITNTNLTESIFEPEDELEYEPDPVVVSESDTLANDGSEDLQADDPESLMIQDDELIDEDDYYEDPEETDINQPESFYPATSSQIPEGGYSPANQQYHVPVIQKKHESVRLVPYEEYVEIDDTILNAISTMEKKLSPESLINFVGIASKGITNTKIEKYRIDFVKRTLSEVKFERLREHHRTETSRLVSEYVSSLKKGVTRAWGVNYEEKAIENKAELLEMLNETAQTRIADFTEKQENISNEKVKKLQAEQQIALQSFLAKQQAEYDLVVATESERVRSLTDTFKDSTTSELKAKKEEVIDNEWCNVKNATNVLLIDGKQELSDSTSVDIQLANDDVWNKAMEYIIEIQEILEQKTPLWASEIKEFSQLEEQEHNRKVSSEELRLKSERLEIERAKAEVDLEKMKRTQQELDMANLKLEKESGKNELLEMRLSQLQEEKQSSKPNMLKKIIG